MSLLFYFLKNTAIRQFCLMFEVTDKVKDSVKFLHQIGNEI